jgi:hypothetical protein
MGSLKMKVIFWTILSATVMASVFPAPAHAQKNPQPKAESKASSLTGCIDEDSGHYILVDDRELKPIADLEADGFPEEGFAKHLGQKVIVRGISSPGDKRPRMKVRSIETTNETCAPQQHP